MAYVLGNIDPQDLELTSSLRGEPQSAYEDLDQATVIGSDDTATTRKRIINVVELFSKEEVERTSGLIPALIIGHDAMVGDRFLSYGRDGFFYYDISASLSDTICRRSVTAIPSAPSQAFFKNHSVRVFVERPPVPEIPDGPFFQYIGDCYILNTEDYLAQEDWAAAPQHLKDLFVTRFIETNSGRKDAYRAPQKYTREAVNELFDKGNIFPLILLHQIQLAQPDGNTLSAWKQPPYAPKLSLESTYSQESAQNEDEPFDVYASAAGFDVPPSPSVTAGEQTRRSSDYISGDAEHVERSVFEDDDEDDFFDSIDNSNDDFTGERDPTDVYDLPPQRAAEFVFALMNASYEEILAFCHYLGQSADPTTQRGRSRIKLLRILHDHIAVEDFDDDELEDGEDEDDDSDFNESMSAHRFSMLPWFAGFEPQQGVFADDGELESGLD
ncbi:hypothetical protein H0H81_009061 [Sphagnurus paluster]|uniref:Uncharacterized protein n=1 Tax=Sphagnurus paluster TaxID=117069 RepID=A0A9P7GRA3_9AGAR|nr:hypothetical protein H0H81_009061 [Sphagnurus paluster]